MVKSGLTPAQLFAQAPEDGGPFGDHLRNYFLRLLNYPELAAALKQVALDRGCSDRKLAYRLESAGLVKTESERRYRAVLSTSSISEVDYEYLRADSPLCCGWNRSGG